MKTEIKLHGLRGWAVLIVLLSHASNRGVNFLGVDFSGAGRYGVFLFFVLSAFLLTRNLIAEPFELRSYQSYLKKRFFRIYPLFLISTMTYFILTLAGIKIISLDLEDILKLYLLVDDKPLFWTIVVEFQFYLILPLIVLYLRLLDTKVKSLCLLGIVFLYLAVKVEAYYSGVVTQFLQIFIAGVFIAIAYSPEKSRSRELQIWSHSVSLLTLLVILVTVPSFYRLLTSQDIPNTYFHDYFSFYAIAFSLVVYYVLHTDKNILFENSFVVFMGKISFSAYLFHLIPLYIVSNVSSLSTVNFILYLASTVFISYLSYRYIEVPLYKKAHKN